ncbi:hypothetical protein F8388_012557 [Cannabis sativa]|uniref:MLO-like protein n=1 Tax=Cannabis sativa TaxID=3483 RepID=A0A7J6DTH2_CANSA|nr:hypothetical protein F8388_012557 [Cannabis sativa]
MAAGAPGERTLQETPTWAVALVCSIFVIISVLIEHAIHSLGKFFKKRNKKAMIEALEKIKAELMLLGFISLLLTVGTQYISKICIPAKFGDVMLPCKGTKMDHDDDRRKLLSYDDDDHHHVIWRRALASSPDYCSTYVLCKATLFKLGITHISKDLTYQIDDILTKELFNHLRVLYSPSNVDSIALQIKANMIGDNFIELTIGYQDYLKKSLVIFTTDNCSSVSFEPQALTSSPIHIPLKARGSQLNKRKHTEKNQALLESINVKKPFLPRTRLNQKRLLAY